MSVAHVNKKVPSGVSKLSTRERESESSVKSVAAAVD